MAESDQRTKHPGSTGPAILICGLAAVALLSLPISGQARSPNIREAAGGTATVLNPDPRSTSNTPAPALTEQEREDMLARKRQLEKETSHPAERYRGGGRAGSSR